MAKYQDLSSAEIASILASLTRRVNPTFMIGSVPRLVAKAIFSLRVLITGAVPIFGGELKKKIKAEAENEVAKSFTGVPRLVEGEIKVAPHHDTPAGIVDFLMLVQQVSVLDQYHAREFLREDSIVIDAGANIGTFTALAASIAKKGRVYAFEPASPARKTLSENIGNASNVEIIPAGLGEKNKREDLGIDVDLPGQSALRDTGYDGTGGKATGIIENVSVVTVDDFVKENKVPRVDFIKMDTEGYEKNIIQGARETIKKFKPVIAASAYHYPGDKEEIPRLVLSIEPGYRYKLSKRAEEDFIFWFPGKE